MTREEISGLLGGDPQSYLPYRDGKIVCGCFDPQRNRRAPLEIDVGNGPKVLRCAEQLAKSNGTVPVFLKEARNRWKYEGLFRAIRFSRDERDLRAYADRRRDAVAVLFLEEAERPPFDDQRVITEAIEGRTFLLEHRRRERSRCLADVKKRLSRHADGALVCEACALSSRDLPLDIGEACFEVHHMLPLSRLKKAAVTKVDDLALLCANCHRLVHATTRPLTVAALKAKIGNIAGRRGLEANSRQESRRARRPAQVQHNSGRERG